MLTEKELQVLVLRREGLLQTDIAKRLKITQGAVSRFEANARKKVREAKKELAILERLGIDIEDETPDSELLRRLGAKR